jgi:hypothetical protein
MVKVNEIPVFMLPFSRPGCSPIGCVVYGSRFLGSEAHRVPAFIAIPKYNLLRAK